MSFCCVGSGKGGGWPLRSLGVSVHVYAYVYVYVCMYIYAM